MRSAAASQTPTGRTTISVTLPWMACNEQTRLPAAAAAPLLYHHPLPPLPLHTTTTISDYCSSCAVGKHVSEPATAITTHWLNPDSHQPDTSSLVVELGAWFGMPCRWSRLSVGLSGSSTPTKRAQCQQRAGCLQACRSRVRCVKQTTTSGSRANTSSADTHGFQISTPAGGGYWTLCSRDARDLREGNPRINDASKAPLASSQ
ncbi:hypothetical protein DL89DRAFT_260750 [Linderina pennispora]|uniref:Uncharacterized protein n=1 Tax=Linderina pennispora TaxID=61395 RepID=A0A1Y1VX49_9FUNG|nr:uncharacterized protein DL89DRAFT_260750 [Linderina pennispora]ORX65783.1 hypothetical protein DL89DRAFT_260750 [Linderina pennispora]